MAPRYLVDTNLLVYTLDRRVPEKRERASEVLRRVGGAGYRGAPGAGPLRIRQPVLEKFTDPLDPKNDLATLG